jgi:hypothetical protein
MENKEPKEPVEFHIDGCMVIIIVAIICYTLIQIFGK